MDLGLALPHYGFSFPDGAPADVMRTVDYARRAESLGFESVWVSDHLFLEIERYGGPPGRHATPEALSMLTAIASATDRVRFGPLVLAAPFRPPALLALACKTIDELSGGRLEVGLGAGWYEPEFVEAGIPFESPRARIAALEQAAHALRDVHAPVFVGGKGGPVIMRVVAESAGGWNVVWRIAIDDYRARLETLRRACERAGRDPATLALSVGLYTLVGADARDLEKRYEMLRAWTPGGFLDDVPLETFAEGALVGTPEGCAERVRELESLGVGRVIVSPASLPFSVCDDEQLEMVARDLMPMVR